MSGLYGKGFQWDARQRPWVAKKRGAPRPDECLSRRMLERFWEKVAMGPADECWPWLASRLRNGYGSFGIAAPSSGRRCTIEAHRYCYYITRGDIPEELCIDHLCGNRACVNPSHLEVVTQRENNRRGRGFAGINARKTHCLRGHPLSEGRVDERGHRFCRKCEAIRARLKYQRMRQAA